MVKGNAESVSLKHYPDKPFQVGPQSLQEWQKSGYYVCQQKVDGWRMILIRTPDGFVALTRHNNPRYSDEFCNIFRKDLESLIDLIPVGTQIDGEWFGRRQVELGQPHSYHVFDTLRWGKSWQINKTLRERLKLLNSLFSKWQGESESIRMVEHAPAGQSWVDYYQAQIDLGEKSQTEGLVVKDLDALMTADRAECKKNKALFKIKFRSGSGGDIDIESRRK